MEPCPSPHVPASGRARIQPLPRRPFFNPRPAPEILHAASEIFPAAPLRRPTSAKARGLLSHSRGHGFTEGNGGS
jgi:hypothetical protein